MNPTRTNIFSLSILFLSGLLVACGNQEPKKDPDLAEETPAFKTSAHQNLAVILTNELDLYDEHRNSISKVTNSMGQIVEIDNISTERFALNQSTDRCDLHHFVRIPKLRGWIYGQFVFEDEKSNRDQTFAFKDIWFKIIATKNFGIGVYDSIDKKSSTCVDGSQSPVILFNSKFNKYEFVPVKNKEVYSQGYFTLDKQDRWVDSIVSTSYANDKLTISIHRKFPEGSADITVEISIDPKQSTAKVLKYSKHPH